jgi:hypothetical protein
MIGGLLDPTKGKVENAKKKMKPLHDHMVAFNFSL